MWLASDVFDARRGAEGAPVRYLVPVQVFYLLLCVVAAAEQPANIVVAAHTFWDDLFGKVAGKCEKKRSLVIWTRKWRALHCVIRKRKYPKIVQNCAYFRTDAKKSCDKQRKKDICIFISESQNYFGNSCISQDMFYRDIIYIIKRVRREFVGNQIDIRNFYNKF